MIVLLDEETKANLASMEKELEDELKNEDTSESSKGSFDKCIGFLDPDEDLILKGK